MADRYCVFGQVFILDGAVITVAEAGRIATAGNTTLNLSTTGGAGTFTIYMASGTTGTVTSGTATITGSPVTLVAGANTITADGAGTCTLNLTIGTAANWDTVNSWSAASGGQCGASVPTSADNTYFNANSFTAASQVLTVNAIASCLDMDWTGATNTPTLAHSATLFVNGAYTGIAAMAHTGTQNLYFRNNNQVVNVTFGTTLSCAVVFGLDSSANLNTWTLLDALNNGTQTLIHQSGTLNTNGQTITCGAFYGYYTYTRVLTLGASVFNCTSWNMGTITGLTLNEGTSSIRVTGTGTFAGGAETYYEVQLNGTAHTVSGSSTFTNFIRNGTATKTDTLTLTAGTTQTVTGVCSLIGNSATNRLLVQSSTLGTAATLDVDGAWTNTNGVDFMDITATHAIDLSSLVTYPAYTGDCGGNTGITFTVAAAQTSATTDTWSTAAKWTSRVPLPQDDVSCSHNATVDMPRIGKSITFTGTPTVSLSNNIENYGSFTLVAGMTYTHNTYGLAMRGRGIYTLTCAGKNIYTLYAWFPNGTITLQDALEASGSINFRAGTLNMGSYSHTPRTFSSPSGYVARFLNLQSSTITLASTSAVAKWSIANTTLDAGTSTIILTNSGVNAQSFDGGGLTYNNVTVEGAGNYALTISGNNTFNTFTVDRSEAAKTITFTDGTTQQMQSFVCTTVGTTVVTLNGTGTAGWNITLI